MSTTAQTLTKRQLAALFLALTAIVIASLFSGCKKDAESDAVRETGTVTDVDGNVYATVKIGDQWWMAENLNTKHFSDSSSIQEIKTNSDWAAASASAYCQYDQNPLAPGLLYNWAAVNDTRKLAPAGWHIATDADWKKLEVAAGMSTADLDQNGWRGKGVAEALRMSSPEGWTVVSDVWSTNTTGFTALAGGCRLFDGRWSDPGLYATGFWWTATASDSLSAIYRYMDYKKTTVFRSLFSKQYGCSVRCVKD